MRVILAAVLVALVAGCTPSASKPKVAPSTAAASSVPGSAPQLLGVRSTSAGTVLVTADGYTLYYSSLDTPSSAKCTGACATTWKPLLGPPEAGAVITGVLSALALPGGYEQGEYEGHPLYTYVGDTAPGDIKGNGLDGTWHVVLAN